MARTVGTGRPVSQDGALARPLRPTPDTVPTDLEFFAPPKGLDTLSPLGRIDRSHSPTLLNLELYKGILQSRRAFAAYGSLPSVPAENTYLAADVEVPGQFAGAVRLQLRWTRSRLQIFSGGDWVDTGTTHLISSFLQDGVDFTMWNNTVVYSSGSLAATPGLIEYTPPTVANPLGASRVLTGSPTAAHVALFGNRIVVSAVTGTFLSVGNRIQWSVKNNDNDWAGFGSGFEDLVVANNDTTDQVMGVYPLSDTTALVVRESSIWRMDLTGFFDAPFLFTLLTDQLGTTARRTVRSVPSGVIFLGYDDVYIVTLSGVQRVGLPALQSVFLSPAFAMLGSAGLASVLARSYGYFDHFNRRYWLNVKNFGLFSYSFDDQGWSQCSVPFEPFSIAQAYYQSGSKEFHGIYLTVDSAITASRFTLREDPTATQDGDAVTGTGVATTFEAWTGFVTVGSALRKTGLVEMQLEYEAGLSQTLFFDYFVNGAWQQFSQIAVSPTTRPSVLSVRRVAFSVNPQVRIRSDTLGQIKIYGLHIFAVQGAMIHP